MCNNHGTCYQTDIWSYVEGDSSCLCDAGFVQYDEWKLDDPYFVQCDKCLEGYSGENCTYGCTLDCSVNGQCINDTDCLCNPGWNATTLCTTCLDGYSGENCTIASQQIISNILSWVGPIIILSIMIVVIFSIVIGVGATLLLTGNSGLGSHVSKRNGNFELLDN